MKRVDCALRVETQNSPQHRMVELKARVGDHEFLKRKLSAMGAEYVGAFSQSDLYFRVPEGRLKLREVKDSDVAELIYYNREDVAGPKSDDAYILRVQESEDLKVILEKILNPTVVVEKVREIYRYQGTRIHLDTVKNLGKFIEFERQTTKDSKKVDEDRVILKQLMETLEIDPSNLVSLSYSDLVGA